VLCADRGQDDGLGQARSLCRFGQRRAELFRARKRIATHRRRIEEECSRRVLQRLGHRADIRNVGDGHLGAQRTPFFTLLPAAQDDTHGRAALDQGARHLAAGPSACSQYDMHDHPPSVRSMQKG
jgi:hypothetical protein